MQMQVGILTLLFNKRESYPLLLDLFLSEGWVQRFWIGGLLDFGANGPLNQNEMIQSTTSWNSPVSRNRIWRRDFWRTISSNSGPLISRLHRRNGEPTHTSKNAILSVRLNFSLKILTWLNRRNRTLIAVHYTGWNSKQWYQVLSVSSEEDKKNRCNETRIVTPPSLVAPIPSVIFWHSS